MHLFYLFLTMRTRTQKSLRNRFPRWIYFAPVLGIGVVWLYVMVFNPWPDQDEQYANLPSIQTGNFLADWLWPNAFWEVRVSETNDRVAVEFRGIDGLDAEEVNENTVIFLSVDRSIQVKHVFPIVDSLRMLGYRRFWTLSCPGPHTLEDCVDGAARDEFLSSPGDAGFSNSSMMQDTLRILPGKSWRWGGERVKEEKYRQLLAHHPSDRVLRIEFDPATEWYSFVRTLAEMVEFHIPRYEWITRLNSGNLLPGELAAEN